MLLKKLNVRITIRKVYVYNVDVAGMKAVLQIVTTRSVCLRYDSCISFRLEHLFHKKEERKIIFNQRFYIYPRKYLHSNAILSTRTVVTACFSLKMNEIISKTRNQTVIIDGPEFTEEM